jgi:hypothetical protein
MDREELRSMLTEALTAEHRRRARERIEDSPEGHSAAMADVALRVFDLYEASENVAADDPEDDPPVQCWHYEPGSPCDWNICRQPERLAAGDRGVDPADTRHRRYTA